ncbi:MAG: GAP family protein [Streptosporangiaceae bacterium]|nr:GAP family protein [Streptosporangiaceae bacterium]MBV9855739.1 GAP family protein [Streptosporangiaceae bacterium]
MLVQAAGFALLAALSPTALLVVAVFLGSDRPRQTGAYYLAGAVLMSVATGVIILVALRGGGLARPSQHEPRYGLRLGLGILALAGGAFMAVRGPKPPDPAKPQKGIVSRLVAAPGPRSAFAAGLLVFAPGVTFIAAVQVVATAKASVPLEAIGLAIVVVLNVILVWLPILAHLIAPERTGRALTAFNGWLRAHGHTIVVVVLVAAGVILTVNGLTGLVRGT